MLVSRGNNSGENTAEDELACQPHKIPIDPVIGFVRDERTLAVALLLGNPDSKSRFTLVNIAIAAETVA